MLDDTQIRFKQLETLTPFRQFIVIILMATITIVCIGLAEVGDTIEWLIALTAIGLFAWLNPIISIFQGRWLNYVWKSILFFGLMPILLFPLTTFISNSSILTLREYRLMLLVTTISYGVTYLVVAIFKTILSILSDV